MQLQFKEKIFLLRLALVYLVLQGLLVVFTWDKYIPELMLAGLVFAASLFIFRDQIKLFYKSQLSVTSEAHKKIDAVVSVLSVSSILAYFVAEAKALSSLTYISIFQISLVCAIVWFLTKILEFARYSNLKKWWRELVSSILIQFFVFYVFFKNDYQVFETTILFLCLNIFYFWLSRDSKSGMGVSYILKCGFFVCYTVLFLNIFVDASLQLCIAGVFLTIIKYIFLKYSKYSS